MKEDYIIALDANGGDNAPFAIVEGAVESLANKEITIVLVGKEEEINRELSKYTYDKNRIIVKNATEVITNEDNPTTAIKQKKDSSMVVGMNLLKNAEASAFVSAGNTGALLAGSTMIVGRIKGIKRPALGTLIPNRKGFTFLMDSGANVDAKPEYLLQFAQMGSIYIENVMNIKNPKVALINNGTEEGKGNTLTKEAYPLLKACKTINFIGNFEARDMPAGKADVVVCDGFVGNVILKYTEGFSVALMGMIKDELMASSLSKIGAFLAKGAFKNLQKRFNYDEVGGAPFLGLNHLVVKAHGSSNSKAIKGAINQAYIFISNNITKNIESAVQNEDDN